MSTRADAPMRPRIPHKHTPRNVNHIHQAELAAAGFNTHLAVLLTKGTGTMVTAYAFAVLAIIGLFGLLGWLNPFIFLLTTWISQQFLQLVLLPVLAVGQNVLGRNAELQADEAFATTQKMYADTETLITQHNESAAKLDAIMTKQAIIGAQNDAIFAQNDKVLDLLLEMQKHGGQG